MVPENLAPAVQNTEAPPDETMKPENPAKEDLVGIEAPIIENTGEACKL